MNRSPVQSAPNDELNELIAAVWNGTIQPEQQRRLEELLAADEASQKRYLACMAMHANLLWRYRGRTAPTIEWPDAHVAAPSLAVPVCSLPSSPATPWGHFVSGWPVAYLIASVIFGVGLVVGAIVHVSSPTKIVHRSVPIRSSDSPNPTLNASIIAHITGMVDCVWEGSGGRVHGSGEATQKSMLHLGDRIALKSGLLEIAYDTGAKVILQGPVTYDVESPAGGYLSIGKLTARLDSHSEISNSKSQISNHQSEIINHKFAVRTPTAVVTDLGTEFGVEVDASGTTRSHVFRGSVRVERRSADGTGAGVGQVLYENQSVRVARDGAHEIAVVPVGGSSGFVRELPKETIRTFDLVDVVAGGDGFSGKRNRGIDPTTGRSTEVPPRTPKSAKEYLAGDGEYHHVDALSMIDGVFIPGGRQGPVQVDSAGHTCDEFPPTSNQTSTYVWAGGRIPADAPLVVRTELGGIDYASAGHGLLFMEANKGITFDLAAIRRANPGWRLLRFRATAGNTETGYEEGGPGSADLWVLVDGQVRLKRREINSFSGIVPVVIPLDDHDRFLTLATTDGGNGITWDWIVYGDPRIEMRPAGVASPGRRHVERPAE